MNEEPFKELREVIERLEDRVEHIDTLLKGNPDYGQQGLLEEQRRLRAEQQDLKHIMEGLQKSEKKRKEDAEAREQKRERHQKWMFGLLTTIISGIVVNLVVLYFSGLIGG